MSKSINLQNVTLLSVSSIKIKDTIKALKKSMKGIQFGEVLFLTDKKPKFLPRKIKYVHIDKITDIEQFNYFMIYELYKYVKTDFILQVHYDGFVVHPELWQDSFLKYDYLGSPWPIDEGFKDENGNYSRVGNSVGIRSYRLLEFPSKAKIPFDKTKKNNEDGFICCEYKHLFEQNGMIFAPLEVAKYFGKELEFEENKDIENTFLFHSFRPWNIKYMSFIKRQTYFFKQTHFYEVLKKIIKKCLFLK